MDDDRQGHFSTEVEMGSTQGSTLRTVMSSAGLDSDGSLDAHVLAIRSICVRRTGEMTREIGSYLLTHFYDGDETQFRSKARDDHTLDQLAARSDLPLSRAFLYRSIIVNLRWRELPEGVAGRLLPSHLLALDVLKDPGVRRRLAEEAAREGLNTDELRERIRAARRSFGDNSAVNRSGRRRTPPWVRCINEVHAAVRDARLHPLNPGSTSAFSPEELNQLASAFRNRAKDLVEFARKIDRCRVARG